MSLVFVFRWRWASLHSGKVEKSLLKIKSSSCWLCESHLGPVLNIKYPFHFHSVFQHQYSDTTFACFETLLYENVSTHIFQCLRRTKRELMIGPTVEIFQEIRWNQYCVSPILEGFLPLSPSLHHFFHLKPRRGWPWCLAVGSGRDYTRTRCHQNALHCRPPPRSAMPDNHCKSESLDSSFFCICQIYFLGLGGGRWLPTFFLEFDEVIWTSETK